MDIEYRVLGRLEVLRDGVPVDLGSHKQRSVLAFMLTRPNTVVATDTLLDEIWGDDGGADKQNTLWVYISGLRSALDPGREKRTDGTVLLTRSPGYVLTVDEGASDALLFEQKIAEARSLVDGDPAGASLLLREGLALWRGRPYEDFTYEPWAAAEIRRLEGLRLDALELRIDADLLHGASRELISELEALRRQHPLRERFVEQLMLALHRSGRTADALRAFSEHSTRMGEELGIEPGHRLRRLEERILVDDPSLTDRSNPDGDTAGLAVRGYELHERLGSGAFGVVYRGFQSAVGRQVAVKVIQPQYANDPGFIRRFQSEAQLVARLEHPHVVPLYDYWREPGAAYLVMRLMGGGSLEALLAERALDTDETARLLTQIGGALASAHDMGVVHRDLKPANILRDGDGNAYLSDFGVAVGLDGRRPGHPAGGSTLTVPYASPEQLDGRPTDARSDLYSLAVVAAQCLTGLTGAYEEIKGALDPAVAAVLDRATAGDPSRRYSDVITFTNELVGVLSTERPEAPEPATASVDNPFKGLRAFTAADAHDFHGRDRTIARLLARLGDAGDTGRFVAVVGPSGSGKSSVVRAGLIPAIRRGALPMSDTWFVVEMKPGMHPFDALEEALVSVAIDPPASLLDILLGPAGVRRAVARVTPDDTQLLLVIDQFEELYTLTDESTRARFIEGLVDLMSERRARCRVVVTLRADFYDRPLEHGRLGELLRSGTEVITPMTASELESAITGPAQRAGVGVDSTVVQSLISDTVDRPGALPLLQYALTELFERRRGRTISLASLDESGGVSGSLVRRADSILEGLPRSAAETARQVLLRLVTIGEEGANDTRRRVLVSSLGGLGSASDIRQVLDEFGRHRLLSFDRDPVSRAPTVEISHEALLTEWATFGEWIEDGRSDLMIHQRVVDAVKEWDASGRDPTYLLRGGRLERAIAWADSTSLALNEPERSFIEASTHERDTELAERALRERQAAESAAKAEHRTRQLTVVAVAAALFLAVAGFALIQRHEATAAQIELDRVQASVRLAVASSSNLRDDPELSAMLAVEAIKATAELGFATPEAVDATHWALQELGATYPVTDSTPGYIRLGPNGSTSVWGLSPHELAELATAAVFPRRLSGGECSSFGVDPCPNDASTDGLEILGGVDAYAGEFASTIPELVVVGPFGHDDEISDLMSTVHRVAARNGFSARYEPIRGTSRQDIEAGALGPIYLLAQPGSLPAIAQDHELVDLAAFLDADRLADEYSEYLLSLGRIGPDGRWPSTDGPLYGIMAKADAKSLIWARGSAFTFEDPETWSEFEETLADIRSSGVTPICLTLLSAQVPGWPATDLIENIVMRSQGPDFYDAWVAHDVPFDHPSVVDAITMAGRLAVDGNLYLGPRGSAEREFWEVNRDLWMSESVKCVLSPMAHFLPGLFEDTPDRPLDKAVLRFPTIDPRFADSMVGGGVLAIAIEDRPDVRAVMAAIASPEWLSESVDQYSPNLLPANRRFDSSLFTDPAFRTISELMSRSIERDMYRFDASDLMPPEIGEDEGAFPNGMLRLFREVTPENVEALSQEIASDIEQVWQALEDGS